LTDPKYVLQFTENIKYNTGARMLWDKMAAYFEITFLNPLL